VCPSVSPCACARSASDGSDLLDAGVCTGLPATLVCGTRAHALTCAHMHTHAFTSPPSPFFPSGPCTPSMMMMHMYSNLSEPLLCWSLLDKCPRVCCIDHYHANTAGRRQDLQAGVSVVRGMSAESRGVEGVPRFSALC
jgi:hypothetical protein